MRIVRRSWSMFLVGAAILVAGCNQGGTTLSPTGPTASRSGAPLLVVDGTGSPDEGSSVYASVRKEDKGSESHNHGPNEHGGGADQKPQGPETDKSQKGQTQLSGFVTAVGNGSILVRGILVTPAPDAVIRHGNRILLITDIVVGDHVQARGPLEEGTLAATEIKVEHTDKDLGEQDTTDGVVSGITVTTSCPVLTFSVGATLVTTSAITTFEQVACATLANGQEVEVEGSANADGSINATKVAFTGITGLVSGLPNATACPDLTFTVGSIDVTTSAATIYDGTSCATIANGQTLEVSGVVQLDGSVAASTVKMN